MCRADRGGSPNEIGERNHRGQNDFYSLPNSGLVTHVGKKFPFRVKSGRQSCYLKTDVTRSQAFLKPNQKQRLVPKLRFGNGDGFETPVSSQSIHSKLEFRVQLRSQSRDWERELGRPEIRLTIVRLCGMTLINSCCIMKLARNINY